MADQEFKFPDEVEIKPVAAEEPDIEIEVIDDTPVADRGRATAAENPEPDEEELSSYSDRVKKRINTLQRAYHDERRLKEQADRERQEAISYATNIVERNNKLVQKSNVDATLLHETWKSKAEGDLESAKLAYKAAYESGDADNLISAQDTLNRATIRHENSLFSKPTLQQEESNVESKQSVYTAPAPDEDATGWASKNPWFGKDREMTGTAYGIHEDLISNGVHPKKDADKYYQEINSRIRRRFPDYDWGDSGVKEPRQKTFANVVAPVTRTVSGNRKIALTKTQVAIAKRLNIPLAEYAKQVAVLNGANNG